MAKKMLITNVKTLKEFKTKPRLVAIGKDAEGYFRKLSMEEFKGIQKTIDKLQGDGADKETEESMNKSMDALFELMTDLMVDETGARIFEKDDKAAVLATVTPEFMGDFMKAFMEAQGLSKEAVAATEATFPE
jgi:hypothetical protein